MTKQDAPTTTDAERADYEKWVLTERPSLLKNTTCLGGDQVEIHVDQIAWIAYQAGASSQAARASSAAAQPWTNVKDALPRCRDDQEYIGINTAGFAGVFNAVRVVNGNTYCLMETAEESVSIMSDLDIWKPFIRPAPPAKPADAGEAPDA